jgi:hypothetical protein
MLWKRMERNRCFCLQTSFWEVLAIMFKNNDWLIDWFSKFTLNGFLCVYFDVYDFWFLGVFHKLCMPFSLMQLFDIHFAVFWVAYNCISRVKYTSHIFWNNLIFL